MGFVCHSCGKSFTSAAKLRAHKAVHDETRFQNKIRFLFEEYMLPMTLKIHVVIDQYIDYFQWRILTMRLTYAEFTETAHSTFKMSKRIHKFTISRKIGTLVSTPRNGPKISCVAQIKKSRVCVAIRF